MHHHLNLRDRCRIVNQHRIELVFYPAPRRHHGGAIHQLRITTDAIASQVASVVRQHSWMGRGFRDAGVKPHRHNAIELRAGANLLKNENDRCANTCHLLQKYRVCFVGTLIG